MGVVQGGEDEKGEKGGEMSFDDYEWMVEICPCNEHTRERWRRDWARAWSAIGRDVETRSWWADDGRRRV